MTNIKSKKDQGGAALIIGLLLLVVITVLAVSGMNTATTELAIARNDQNYENAFQAAETGIETALGEESFPTEQVTIITPYVNSHDEVEARIVPAGDFPVIDDAFSLGVGSGFRAYHYNTISEASSKRIAGGGGDTDRDASALHTQAFYIVGPPRQNIL